MNKFIKILKNKDIIHRIIFTVLIILVIQICSIIPIPGIKNHSNLNEIFKDINVFNLMNLLAGGLLKNFSIVALGISPYITSQIIIQLLGQDVLHTLTELSEQGENGRIKKERVTRFLTLLLGSFQAYGIIRMLENRGYITIYIGKSFWSYLFLIAFVLAGSMMVIWLADQITEKGIGNGISIIVLIGCIKELFQIKEIFIKWIWLNRFDGLEKFFFEGILKFFFYFVILFFIFIFIIFIELSERRIPIYTGSLNNNNEKISFLPIKINSFGVTPVIFSNSIMSVPFVFTNLLSDDVFQHKWLNFFSYKDFVNIKGIKIPFGFFIYLFLIFVFSFFYSNMQLSPKKISENFQKNGSYIPGVRPGIETEKYIFKVLNKVTLLGAFFLVFISGFPIILSLFKVLGKDIDLALSGTSFIIIVSTLIEINSQVNSLFISDSFNIEDNMDIENKL